MEFENVKNVDENTYTFTLKNAHVSYANTLRRLIITGVETVAFRADMTSKGTTTDVAIKSNTTPMTNEMLAHRIGLLPIYVKEPLKWDSDKYSFHLNVHGNKDSTRDVFANDFVVTKVVETEEKPVQVPTEQFFVPNSRTRQTCLIATLYPGEDQKIDLIAKATLGTGRENARFQPTSQCSYEYTRDTDPARINEMFKNWLRDAKKVDPESFDKEPEKLATFEREFNTMEVARCYLVDERGEPYSFDFTVESTGILDVPYIVRRACDVGEAMVAKYVNIDKTEIPEGMTVTPADSRILGFDFLIKNQDHTFGNLIQTYLEQNHIDGPGETKITYAGYKVPHPLRDEVLIRVGVNDGEQSTARKAFAEACNGCVLMFRQMREAWSRATGMEVVTPATATAPKKIVLGRKKIGESKK
jgi:DNA-directed RNA polymerase II subunit RPB3